MRSATLISVETLYNIVVTWQCYFFCITDESCPAGMDYFPCQCGIVSIFGFAL